MKLPNDCPFSEAFSKPSREPGSHPPNCCQAGANAYVIGTEPPLCRARQTECEVYRFIWRSSFDGDALVQVASTDNSVLLQSRLLGYLSPRVPSPSLTLAPDDWDTLQRALEASDFWSLNTEDNRLGLDGAQWFIEGRRGDVYHAINRWSPGGAVRDLGRLFFALTGSPLTDIELY